MVDDFELQALRSDARERERRKWFIAARERRQEQELRQDNADQEILEIVTGIALADAYEVEAFKADLGTYDALTIEAIMENREILERLYLERQTLLDNAYRLDDGTRVFKSEDGVTVFDESGNRVSPDTIDPDMIDDRFTKAEPFFANRALIQKHEVIDQKLMDYQQKLDDARERLDSGELSQNDFEELQNDITKSMPIEVRRKLPDYDPSQETDLRGDFSNTVKPVITPSPTDMAIDPSMVPGLN